MKKLIIASTSTVYGKNYLEYLFPALSKLFNNVTSILFISYARPSGISHEDYTLIAKNAFKNIGIDVLGIESFKNPVDAVLNAKGIFIGGGNTFLLTKQLYENKLIEPIKDVVTKGVPYLGTSAGSNVTGLTMQNTNDMPIVYPPSFTTFEFIPFNLNCHYLDPIEGSTHMGETRETRIKEYHNLNSTPVLGLREGSWLEVSGNSILLRGELSARLFIPNQEPKEYSPGTNFNFLD